MQPLRSLKTSEYPRLPSRRGQQHLLQAYRCRSRCQARITMDDGADTVGVIHSRRTDLIPNIMEEPRRPQPASSACEACRGWSIGISHTCRERRRYQASFDNRYAQVKALSTASFERPTYCSRKGLCRRGYGYAVRTCDARRWDGARVVVCEVDPLRGLRPLWTAISNADGRGRKDRDIFCTVTATFM